MCEKSSNFVVDFQTLKNGGTNEKAWNGNIVAGMCCDGAGC